MISDTRRASSTITLMCQLMPLTPMPLLPTAPMMPATDCPCCSTRWVRLLWMKFQPWVSSTYPLRSLSLPSLGISPRLTQMLGARSSWSTSKPLSNTATTMVSPRAVTPPVVMAQAFSAWMVARPHCSCRLGSSGSVRLST